MNFFPYEQGYKNMKWKSVGGFRIGGERGSECVRLLLIFCSRGAIRTRTANWGSYPLRITTDYPRTAITRKYNILSTLGKRGKKKSAVVQSKILGVKF